MYLTITMMISIYQTANAQYQEPWKPDTTCLLCDPPLEIVELRGLNFNVHELPVMHIYEGQSSTSKYNMYRPPNLLLKYDKNANPRYDETVSSVGEQYMIDPQSVYVRIASQSTPNTIISSNAQTNTSQDVYIPWSLFSLKVTAGTPGKKAIAWLVAGGLKELVFEGYRTGIMSEVAFIQPVVVYPSPLPLFIQEIVINDDNRLSSNFFSLKDQKKGERVVPVSQTCSIIYDRAPYGGDYVKKTPHYLKLDAAENCADLLNVFTLRRNELTDQLEWILIKRILLLVHNGSKENTTEYYNGYTIFNGINKGTSKLVPVPK